MLLARPPTGVERRQRGTRCTNLGEESAELLEGLQQAGVADLLDDKDTFWRRVPRQSLAGWILNVPAGKNTTSGTSEQERPDND